MPDRCVVFGCDSGYDSARKNLKEGETISFFRPKTAQFEMWQKAIPIPPEKFKKNSPVCEKHFESKFILDKIDIALPDGTVYSEKRKRKDLTANAVPSIFPNCPSYLTKKPAVKRRVIVRDPDGLSNSVEAKKPTLEDNPINNSIDLDMAENIYSESTWQDKLHKNPASVSLPSSMWATVHNNECTVFVKLSKDLQTERSVSFPKLTPNVTPNITFAGRPILLDLKTIILTVDDVGKLLSEIDDYTICPGTGFNDHRSTKCTGFCSIRADGRATKRCSPCFSKKHSIKKFERSVTKSLYKIKKRTMKLQRKSRSLAKKVQLLQEKLEAMMQKYDDLKKSQINDLLATLPPRQQEAVSACISAARAKKPNGKRYTNQWMYECALMRIKSCSLYRKMLRDQTLSLPSLRTLQRYMKRLKPSYGFIPATFELLGKKSAEMKEGEKHGVLLVDEMSLNAFLSFNKSSLKGDGFVNLGKYTPDKLKDEPGDHALVFMFKPFKGQWFQTIAAFLSKGAVDGSTLSKLALEATALIEQAGLKVDMWVCDGAPWNRVMWRELGVTNPFTKKKAKGKGKNRNGQSAEQPETPVVGFTHPCDANRQIFMCSDFPHLIKCLKGRILPNEKGVARDLITPDGVVKFSHWVAVYEADNDGKLIQVCPGLTRDHLYPHNYQTMNVGMAHFFFSKKMADAMEHYKKEGVPGLQNCDGTIKFIRQINDLIDAMNANTPKRSIRKDTSEAPSEKQNRNLFKDEKNAREIIVNFLSYLQTWHEIPGKANEKLPHQTQYGLYVTLNSALQLADYLIDNIGFDYVMTSRMNQDALEHFFGAVRQACGCNTHPDPVQFIQVYRLISVASLVKPPRGSNVTGGEMLNALLNASDVLSEKDKERHALFERELDDLLDSGESIDELDDMFENAYNTEKLIDLKALRMFAGYVARKARRSTVAKTCDACFQMLQSDPATPSNNLDSLIDLRSQGFLIKPSDELFKLISQLEKVVCQTLDSTKFNENILFEVLENAKGYVYNEAGCNQHKRELTKEVMRFYLTTRMIFACKNFNKRRTEDTDKRKRLKERIKKYKLMSASKTN